MEVQQISISDTITRLDIGNEIDDKTNTLTGAVELDIENQSLFIDIINSVFDNASVHLIVEMKNITYIDSSGLWALYEGHKKALQNNKKLILLNPSKDVKRVLDITKMSSKLDIFDNVDDAIKSLS